MGTNEFMKKQAFPLGYAAPPGSIGLIAGIYPREYCRSCEYLKYVKHDGKKKAICKAAEFENKAILGYILPGSPACELWKSKPRIKVKKKQIVGDDTEDDQVPVEVVKQSDQLNLLEE